MTQSPVITTATRAECAELAAFAARMVQENFAALYAPENIDHYLARYTTQEYFAEALDAGDEVALLRFGTQLIGYASVGHVRLPVEPPPPHGAHELHRIYVDQPFQRHGFGKQLILHMLSLPRIQTAPALYVGVWEENVTMQALCHQFGFRAIGHYAYEIGSEADYEIIMVRYRDEAKPI